FGVPVCVGDTIEAESRVLGVKASSSERDRGVVHVQTTGWNQRGEVVLAYQRKVQAWKGDVDAPVHEGEAPAKEVPVSLALPPYDPKPTYAGLAHRPSADTNPHTFHP